jgi:hypothetical protein
VNPSYKLLWWEKNRQWEVDNVKNMFIEAVSCSHLTPFAQLINLLGYLCWIISCAPTMQKLRHVKLASLRLTSIMPNGNAITEVFYSLIVIGNGKQAGGILWN